MALQPVADAPYSHMNNWHTLEAESGLTVFRRPVAVAAVVVVAAAAAVVAGGMLKLEGQGRMMLRSGQ